MKANKGVRAVYDGMQGALNFRASHELITRSE